MKESYGKGLANHPGPELCGGDSEVAAEALGGVHLVWPKPQPNGTVPKDR